MYNRAKTMNGYEKIKNRWNALSENNRIVVANIAGAFVIKGLSLVVSLLTTPAYIHFFNNEVVLGVWFTILSVTSWILNFDLGIGNGLRNHLTTSFTKNDFQESRRLISSAYVVIGALCVGILVIALVAFEYVNWNAFFKIDSSIVSKSAMKTAVRIVFSGIVLQIFMKIISSVLYAIQKSSVNNAIALATSVLLVIAMLLAPSRSNDQNIVFLAVIYDIAVLLPYLITSVIVFSSRKYKVIAPKLNYASRSHAKKVLSLGGYFFIIQILYMLIMSTNEYLISYMTNSGDVVKYRVYFQLFTLGSTIFALTLTPIWSAVTKAIAERNVEWVNKLYHKLLIGGILGTIIEFLIIPFLQPIFNIWLPESSIQADVLIGVAFASLGGLMIFNAILSNVANGIGKLRTQLLVFLFSSLIKIPLSILFVRIFGSWVGVVVATDFLLLLYCIVQPVVIKKDIARLNV